MTTNESWRRFLDAGTAVGAATLSRAAEIAKGLIDAEPATRERARRELDDLGRSGRALGEHLADLARSRLTTPLGHAGSIEETLDWIADLVSARTRHREPPPPAPEDTDRLGGDTRRAPEPEARKHGHKNEHKNEHKKKEKQRGKSAKGQRKEPSAKDQKPQKPHKGDRGAQAGAGADRVVPFSRTADPADRR